MVVGPASGDRNGDLVVAGALERPVIVVRDLFDHVHRVEFARDIDFEKVHQNIAFLSWDAARRARPVLLFTRLPNSNPSRADG